MSFVVLSRRFILIVVQPAKVPFIVTASLRYTALPHLQQYRIYSITDRSRTQHYLPTYLTLNDCGIHTASSHSPDPMPPKGWRKTAEGFQPTNSAGDSIKDRVVHGIEDLLLPRSVITKIAKQSLPDGTPIPKDGVTALMRSATMFTSYITAEANSLARQQSRRTITHTDILKALEKCDFAAFVGPTVELTDLRQQKGQAPANDSEDAIQEDVEPEIIPIGPTFVEPKRMRSFDDTREDMDVE